MADLLGRKLTANTMLTYNSKHGYLGVANGRPAWVMPESQVAFQVTGEKGSAIVCAEAKLIKNKPTITMLTLDSPLVPGTLVLTETTGLTVRNAHLCAVLFVWHPLV